MTSRRPLILFRTGFFGRSPLDLVPAQIVDHFTTDLSRIGEADAVIFHIPDWRRSLPEDTPKFPGQKWVAWSMESKVSYRQLADPQFLGHFELRMTYEQGADIWMPYLPSTERWRAAMAEDLPVHEEPVPVVMFQSARDDRSGRNAFSAELMRCIAVDSYGRLFNNRRLTVPDRGPETKLATIRCYRFCLGLENAPAHDYVTEKLFEPLLAGTVPIYRGAPNVREFAPEHSYIDAEAHDGPAGLAAYLRHLMACPQEYAAYFAWRTRPLPAWLEAKLEAVRVEPFARLLELIADQPRVPGAGRTVLPFGRHKALQTRIRRMLRRARRAVRGR